MKKRLLRMILPVLVLVFMTCTAQAKPLPAEAAAERISTNPGQTVEYHLFLTGNPGLAGFRFQLTYDTDVLTPVTFENSAEIDCSRGDFSAQGSLSGARTASGCRFVWYSTTNSEQDGTLLTFRFRVSGQAAEGTYPVRLSCNSWDMVDQNGTRVAVACTDGEVEVHRYLPKLYTVPITVRQGEEFDYAVYVQDNPGAASLQLELALDKNRFELITDSEGAPLCTVGENFSVGSFQVKGGAAALKAIWYQPRNSSANGVLFTVRFRAKADAQLGETSVHLRLDGENSLDENEQPIELSCLPSSVTILSDAEVSIKKLSDHDLQIMAKSGSAAYAVTAVYNSEGQMTELSVAEFTGKFASDTLTVRKPLNGSTCKVILLSGDYVPISPVTVKTID